jgi:N-acetylglucosamine kinase-like BadF-type ATPase
LLVGIDGGGTHTVALLARAEPNVGSGWMVLGRGHAGPSNLQSVGAARALDALGQAVAGAFAAARLARITAAAACLGLAGAGRPEDQAVIAEWAARVQLAAAVEVTGDAPLVLAAGTPRGWGAALVAGTGSMAFVRDPGGRMARAGGWGYLLGDEGSGYALVVAALQACATAADGRGPVTALLDRILSRLGLAEPQQLIGAVYRGALDRTGLAALAPVVFDTADAGDPVAMRIVDQGADQLAATVAAAARQLKLEAAPLPLALAGGVILASARYASKVVAAMASRGFRADPVTLVREPAEGAVRLALAKQAGLLAKAGSAEPLPPAPNVKGPAS